MYNSGKTPLDRKETRIIIVRSRTNSLPHKVYRTCRVQWNSWYSSIRKEFAVLLLASFAAWLFAAFTSYTFYQGAWAGTIGYYVSALFYTLFGNGSWALLLLAWYIPPHNWFAFRSSMPRRLGALFSALCAGAIFSGFFATERALSAGGYVGLLSTVLTPLIGIVGMTLLTPLFLMASCLAVLGVSFQDCISAFRAAGKGVGRKSMDHIHTLVKKARHMTQLFSRRKSVQASFDESSHAASESVSVAGHNESVHALSEVTFERDNSTEHLATVETPFVERTNVQDSVHKASQPLVSRGRLSSIAAQVAAPLRERRSIGVRPGVQTPLAEKMTPESRKEEALEELAESELVSASSSTVGHTGDHADATVRHENPVHIEASSLDMYADAARVREERGESFSAHGRSYERPAETTTLTVTHEEVVQAPLPPFVLPDLALLFPQTATLEADNEAFMAVCRERAQKLEEKLGHFGVRGCVTAVRPGPVITLFEYEPEADTKISKITALEDDLALSLRALSIRIIAPVPGKNVVGFEIANEERRSVYFAEVATHERLIGAKRTLPLAIGVDTAGNPVVYDLAKMPHLLVAGSTGSGKSVGMNVMLVSLLCSKTPEELRFILIDPKRLEFAPYADIPHLLFPIITNPQDAAPVLQWVILEMERRYEIMAKAGVRNIADYHVLPLAQRESLERDLEVKKMPYIVIMIDELADLMMVAGKEIETHVARIAQMARAAGIHMIVATQRPSVDVVTGLIKVNFPSRLAFRVSTKIDSRTIVDAGGAEKLLGKGDMLYMSPARATLQRLHCPFVSDEEITHLTSLLKQQRKAAYLSIADIVAEQRDSAAQEDWEDSLYEEVCSFLDTVDEVSISLLQRKYRVGFNRSARLIEMLERDGYVASAQGGKPRRVLK